MRYPNASIEPLEIIRINECDAETGLATSRFQALWNEIESLQDLLRQTRNYVDKDHYGMLAEIDAALLRCP
jgi:hypothetical protein